MSVLSDTTGTAVSPDIEVLADELRNQNVVVLCGAGLSMSSPTNIPSGSYVKGRFLHLIRHAMQHIGGEPGSGLTRGLEFPTNALPRMPERTLQQFHHVFGDHLFRFLDPFFPASARPNHNHKNLARLAARGFLRQVITVNFDFALETAFLGETGAWPRVVTPDADPASRRQDFAPTIHKPHGTLKPEQSAAPPEIKYADIRYTVERIGTALDDSLVAWFRQVIGDRSIFVTCYSADDLDVFPALQEALTHGKGRVYWNWHHAPPSPMTEKWFSHLGPRHTKIGGDVDQIIGPIVTSLGLSRAGHLQGPMTTLSLDHVSRGEQDVAGAVLAAALICHDSEARRHVGLRDRLIECLERGRLHDAVDRDPRKAALLDVMIAGRSHEAGDIARALQGHRNIKRRFDEARDAEEPLPDWIGVRADADIAYDEAWALKRRDREPVADSYRGTVRRATRAILVMVWRSWMPVVVRPEVRALASHFLGEFPLTWAMELEVGAPTNLLSRVLYRIAYGQFRKAASGKGGFVARDVFHQMRREESKLLLLRTRWFWAPSKRTLAQIDASLRHFRYLNGDPPQEKVAQGANHGTEEGLPRRSAPNAEGTPNNNSDLGLGVMGGDVARGVHLLLEATRSALAGRPEAVRACLDEAWNIFTRRGYGSGLYRVQVYEWLLGQDRLKWWRTLPTARIKLRHALRLRKWNTPAVGGIREETSNNPPAAPSPETSSGTKPWATGEASL